MLEVLAAVQRGNAVKDPDLVRLRSAVARIDKRDTWIAFLLQKQMLGEIEARASPPK